MRWSIVVVLALVACGSSKKADPDPAKGGSAAAGAARTFQLSVLGEDAPVAVEMAVPSGWTQDATMSKPSSPMWKIDGARMLSLAAIAPRGDDAAARMAKAIEMQYDDAAGAERSDLPDGRVWMVRKEGTNTHARMFVPFDKGVVMGVAILAEEGAGKLPAIKQAFETIKIAAAP